MKRNILFLVFGLLIAFSFSYIKTTQGADKTTAVKGVMNLDSSTFVISDNGVAESVATSTLTPITTLIKVDCQDADGCNMEVSELNSIQGDIIFPMNISTNSITVPLEITATSLPFWEPIFLIYEGTSWAPGHF